MEESHFFGEQSFHLRNRYCYQELTRWQYKAKDPVEQSKPERGSFAFIFFAYMQTSYLHMEKAYGLTAEFLQEQINKPVTIHSIHIFHTPLPCKL